MHIDRPLLDLSTYPLIQLGHVVDLHLDVFLDHNLQRLFLVGGETRFNLPNAMHERRKPTRDGVVGVLRVPVVHVVEAVRLDKVVKRVADRVMVLELVFVRRAVRFFHRRDRTTAVLVPDDGDCVLHPERGQRGECLLWVRKEIRTVLDTEYLDGICKDGQRAVVLEMKLAACSRLAN